METPAHKARVAAAADHHRRVSKAGRPVEELGNFLVFGPNGLGKIIKKTKVNGKVYSNFVGSRASCDDTGVSYYIVDPVTGHAAPFNARKEKARKESDAAGSVIEKRKPGRPKATPGESLREFLEDQP